MSELSETAVRCGIGSKAFKNAGNELFRRLVNVNREEYQSSNGRCAKRCIVAYIIERIKSQEPPGKFIEKNLKTGTWHEVDDKRAYFKTSQALRERVRRHADKRGRSPAFQEKVDEMQNNGESSLSHQNSFCGLFESTTHHIIPEPSKVTQHYPIVNQVAMAKRYSESSFKKKIEISQETHKHEMQCNLFMNSFLPVASKDFLPQPFRELSYALNHAVNVGFGQTKIKSPCALEGNPHVVEDYCTECHNISPVTNESNLGKKCFLHSDLHVVNKPASSVQQVNTEYSDALCEALLEKFIRENLSDNEI